MNVILRLQFVHIIHILTEILTKTRVIAPKPNTDTSQTTVEIDIFNFFLLLSPNKIPLYYIIINEHKFVRKRTICNQCSYN